MKKNQESIKAAIELLEQNGYIVKKDYSMFVGKWVTFHQKGMIPMLHGKIIRIIHGSKDDCFEIRCKNGYYRYKNYEEILQFYDKKQDCYKVKY